jgi:prolyl-tRNA editing enzyme YbaK/EbsC (Cys-tRNA(Pro) deacylase)
VTGANSFLSSHQPPGLTLPAYDLNRAVITCLQAADAKGIPLRNELKTIILETTVGVYVVHVPGDRQVSLRKIKTFLKARQVCLASPEYLRTKRLSPGTVCPVLDPVWGLLHLVSSLVLDLEFVSTNNGTPSMFFLFSPKLLLAAQNVKVGDFTK